LSRVVVSAKVDIIVCHVVSALLLESGVIRTVRDEFHITRRRRHTSTITRGQDAAK